LAGLENIIENMGANFSKVKLTKDELMKMAKTMDKGSKLRQPN